MTIKRKGHGCTTGGEEMGIYVKTVEKKDTFIVIDNININTK